MTEIGFINWLYIQQQQLLNFVTNIFKYIRSRVTKLFTPSCTTIHTPANRQQPLDDKAIAERQQPLDAKAIAARQPLDDKAITEQQQLDGKAFIKHLETEIVAAQQQQFDDKDAIKKLETSVLTAAGAAKNEFRAHISNNSSLRTMEHTIGTLIFNLVNLQNISSYDTVNRSRTQTYISNNISLLMQQINTHLNPKSNLNKIKVITCKATTIRLKNTLLAYTQFLRLPPDKRTPIGSACVSSVQSLVSQSQATTIPHNLPLPT